MHFSNAMIWYQVNTPMHRVLRRGCSSRVKVLGCDNDWTRPEVRVDEHQKSVGEYELLQKLVVDNSALERLESLITGFNIFEAIGAVRQEPRHSDFLAFLLDPGADHGLGDAFAKRLWQARNDRAWRTLPNATTRSVS